MSEIGGIRRNTMVLIANSKSQLTVTEIQVATIAPPTDLASSELTLACIGNRVPVAIATSARKMFCGFTILSNRREAASMLSPLPVLHGEGPGVGLFRERWRRPAADIGGD